MEMAKKTHIAFCPKCKCATRRIHFPDKNENVVLVDKNGEEENACSLITLRCIDCNTEYTSFLKFNTEESKWDIIGAG